MSGCEQHRPYLAALADGETELVPAATSTHVAHCRDCSEEVQTHRLLGAHMRASVNEDQLRVRPRTRRGGLAGLGGAAVVVIAVAGAAAG